MKKLLDKMRAPFEKGGKLEKYWPVFDSIETFLYTPGHATTSGSHIRDAVDLKRTMFTVIIALTPALLFGMWNAGNLHYAAIGEATTVLDSFLWGLLRVLPMIIVSYGVGLGIEFIFCIKNGHAIQEGFLVSGLLIPMIMPIDAPLWMVAFSVAFAVVLAKEVFGGTGMNVVNVALTARAFMFFAYPTMMSGDKVWINTEGGKVVDGHSGATALGELATTVDMKLEAGKSVVENMFLAADAKFSIMNSFYGMIPGSIGETSALACLIGAVILIATGVGSWKVMVSFLVGGLTMGWIFNALGSDVNAYMTLSPVHQVLLGGFAFGMVFMATDPVTAAQTATGKWIYGFFGGFFAIMIRVFNPAYPEGVMLAILFMNVMAPLIDHYVVKANVKRRLNRVKTA